jgi:DNA (cytosine-5)-methyltransferase 1
VNGDLPPEVWAERDVAATLNLNDLGSESRSVELVVSATGDVTHALTSEGADASEDGTGRGTPIITFGHVNGIDIQPSTTTTTIRAGHDAMPSIATETTVRRLTPRECERLQGFPDDWTLTSNGKPQADSARYRQMGNAVAVPCVEWIARRIVGVA